MSQFLTINTIALTLPAFFFISISIKRLSLPSYGSAFLLRTFVVIRIFRIVSNVFRAKYITNFFGKVSNARQSADD